MRYNRYTSHMINRYEFNMRNLKQRVRMNNYIISSRKEPWQPEYDYDCDYDYNHYQDYQDWLDSLEILC